MNCFGEKNQWKRIYELDFYQNILILFFLSGAVLDGLRSYYRQLSSFPQRNRIDPTGQEKFDKSVLAWHMAFTNLMVRSVCIYFIH